MRLSVCLFAWLIVTGNVWCQGFLLGPNPPSLKWRQIDTDKVQVIFPLNNELEGQRVANLVHYLYDSSRISIGDRAGKISIFIQNQDTRSNGFVSGSPFRSELFITPPQFNFNGTADYLDILTIHEYRHVQQFLNARQGITGLIAKVFGQIGWTSISRLALPQWYWEGDAIVIETALTHSGRGRLPDFTRQYWALAMNDRFYNYEKASAGSYKDFVPDPWHHGYFMVKHLRTKYSRSIVKHASQEAVRYKGLFYPFSNSLKRVTGKGTFGLHSEMLKNLSDSLKSQEQEKRYTQSEKVNLESKKTFTNYTNPKFLDNNTLIVEKAGLDQIPAFFKIDQQGREEKITAPGLTGTVKNRLGVTNGILTWSELTYDKRWRYINYQVVRSFDMASGKKTKVTTKSKYFSPALSHDLARYVVVESPEDQKVKLVILDARNGQVLTRVDNPDQYLFVHPIWAEDDKSIFAVVRKDNQNGIIQIDLEDQQSSMVLDYTHKQITFPLHSGEHIYYSASYQDVENIFALNLQTNQIFQVTDTRFGAIQPTVSPDGSTLAYSEYTVDGYDIRKIPVEPSDWQIKDPIELEDDYYPDLIPEFEGGNIMDRIPNTQFTTKKFKQTNRLINFHSWQPYVIHPEYGLDFVAQNKLSTFSTVVGYRYNVNEDFGQFRLDLSYAAFYPVFNLEARSLGRRERLHPQVNLSDSSAQLTIVLREWEESDVFPGITLPVNLTHDNWFSSLRFNANYHLLYVNYETFENSQADGILNAADFQVLFNHSLRLARKHINPRWFQLLDISYKKTINTMDKQGQMFQITGTLGFPGMWRNHSTWIAGSYKSEGFSDPYKFVDQFVYARGYPSTIYDDIYRFSFNYSLPLWYPDFAVGPLAFLQRIKTNLFIDLSRTSFVPIPVEELNGEFFLSDQQYRSLGAELTFNFRFIRLFDFDMGVRYSYLLDNDTVGRSEHQFDFIILSLGI